jgi:CRP-like cAMP-binding protein
MPAVSGCDDFRYKHAATRTIPAGTLLIEQGLVGSAIYLLDGGLVELVRMSEYGQEKTIALRAEGWYAGYTSAILKSPNTYSVRALTACRVVRIPAADFTRRLAQDAELLGHFLSVLCMEIAAPASLDAELMSGSEEEHLGCFMLDRSVHSFDPTQKQVAPAKLPALKPEEFN